MPKTSMLRTVVCHAISPLLAFLIARPVIQLSTRHIGMIMGHQRSGMKSPTLESFPMGIVQLHQSAGDTITATPARVPSSLIVLTMTFLKVITTLFVMVRSITVLTPQQDAHLRATTGKTLAAAALRKRQSLLTWVVMVLP